MTGYYRNYEVRVPMVYPSDDGPRPSTADQGSKDNPAFVDETESPVSDNQSFIKPSNGVSGYRQAPAPPPRHVGLQPRDRKPWAGIPMDRGATYTNPGCSDDQSSLDASSISGHGAILGNLPVLSVMPEKKRKGSTDADFYAIKPAESLYPELPKDFGETGDIVTNPPEVNFCFLLSLLFFSFEILVEAAV